MIQNNDLSNWKLINYRKVDDLISAEFLHDLYNRHIPEVNSVRFRNTLCIYKGTEFCSYAPIEEWDKLAETLGYKLYKNDAILLKEIEAYINKPKEGLLRLLNDIKNKQLSDNNKELFHKLMDLHYIALGEIYGINLVQIEHALAWSLKKHLNEQFDLEKHNEILPMLIELEEHTVCVEEEIVSLKLSIDVSKKLIKDEEAKNEYDDKFSKVRFAYGAVNNNDEAKHRIDELCAIDLETRVNKLNDLENAKITSKKKSELYEKVIKNEKIKVLSDISSKIGKLRDNNKALMGQVSFERNRILDEIARRMAISRSDISRYLLSELQELLEKGLKVSEEVINERWEYVILQRQERILTGESSKHLYANTIGKNRNSIGNIIFGECASEGKITGNVKKIKERSDCSDVTEKDVIIARGTDFDLMEGLIKCGGIITEEGGILSHASVVARELKKPCLINVSNALSLFSEGAQIYLNATEGKVEIIKDTEREISHENLFMLHDADNKNNLGFKASRLGTCIKNGINVLPGVIVSCNIEEKDINEKLSKNILNIFLKDYDYSGTLIIRSSSPYEDRNDQSLAGIFESDISEFDEFELLTSLKKVKGASKSNRVKEYIGKEEDIPVAILVQPYLNQSLGGVAFSINPLNNSNELIIELNSNGAHYITQGKEHEKIIINKEKFVKDSKYLAAYNKYVVLVANMVLKLETLFNCPVDVEWGIREDKLYIFQVRPIVNTRGTNHD